MPPTPTSIAALTLGSVVRRATRAAMPHRPTIIPATGSVVRRAARPPTPTRIAAIALAAALTLAGCGQPPDPTVGAGPNRSPSPRVATRPPTRPPIVTTPPATPTFAEGTAVPCNGFPTPNQIVTLLRRTPGALPANATATVRTGPLCAGAWQHTLVVVPNQDPLQVITKGQPTALVLVAAGTDVCTPDVLASAPPGIRLITRC